MKLSCIFESGKVFAFSYRGNKMGPLTPTPTMDIIYDLIEEAKLRLLWWALCIFAISYFFTRKLFLFPSCSFLYINNDSLMLHLLFFYLGFASTLQILSLRLKLAIFPSGFCLKIANVETVIQTCRFSRNKLRCMHTLKCFWCYSSIRI